MRVDIRFFVFRVKGRIAKDKDFLFTGGNRRIGTAAAAAQNACCDTEHQKDCQNLFHVIFPFIIKK